MLDNNFINLIKIIKNIQKNNFDNHNYFDQSILGSLRHMILNLKFIIDILQALTRLIFKVTNLALIHVYTGIL
jgi:hypothetical protein